MTELLVKRRLAIAGLIPPILNAYRKGEIEPRTIQLLTMATPAQQKKWFKLKEDAPTGTRLKAWLFGAEIPVSSAIFPPEKYPGNIVSDLFGEDRYFDDAEKFWKLQTEAVIHRQAAYLEEGWSDVIIMEIGAHFNQYDKVKCAKSKGGKVYISCAHNGEIGFHEGWLDQKEAARREKEKERKIAAAKGEEIKEEKAPAKAELTSAAIRYVDLHRQNAVRVELLKSPQIAIRLLAASVISREGLWQVRPENQDACRNEAIAASVEGSKARAAFDAEREAVRALLGLPKTEGFLVALEYGTVGTAELFARLLALSDEDVLRVLTFLMAESLPAGSEAVEALGHLLAVDMDAVVDAGRSLLRTAARQAGHQRHAGGGRGQAGRLHPPDRNRQVQKDAIQHCLAGTGGRKKVENWKPRYFRFPMQAYTKRKGLPAVENWNAIKKHFDKKQ